MEQMVNTPGIQVVNIPKRLSLSHVSEFHSSKDSAGGNTIAMEKQRLSMLSKGTVNMMMTESSQLVTILENSQ